MNIGTIKKYLEHADKSLPVYFDFCNCVPTTVESWRGVYAHPAIGWEDCQGTGNTPSVEDFLEELNLSTSGKIYKGWKGGDYTYNDDDTLHVDNPGMSSSTEIIAIEVGDYSVTIHTRKNEPTF